MTQSASVTFNSNQLGILSEQSICYKVSKFDFEIWRLFMFLQTSKGEVKVNNGFWCLSWDTVTELHKNETENTWVELGIYISLRDEVWG